MPNYFTNTHTAGTISNDSNASKVHSPYVSKGWSSGLTEKEKTARSIRVAHGTSGMGGLSNYGGMGANTSVSGTSQFFSSQLSSDFLELPQSLREKREIYRHFYKADPIVGQAIDLHTELPLSKIRLAPPSPMSCPEEFEGPNDYGKYILDFFERMCKRVKLFQRLITASHHHWLDGSSFIFAEDSTVEVPVEVGHEVIKTAKLILNDDESVSEETEKEVVELEDREEKELAYYQKHYQGWSKLIVLPIDQVKLSSYSFTEKVRIELIPSQRDQALIAQAKAGDELAQEIVQEFPEEIKEYIEAGKLIPLGTDPEEGSFCYHLKSHKSAEDELGTSILDRCIRTLMYREKLRQAQTQIASRAMTPKRLVWGENLSDDDTEALREQVDLSLVDPDYSIVTNYEVHWEELGAKDRLLDVSGEYEVTDKQLFAGLGVTESLLNGESAFSGDRVKLEILNTKYVLFREILQEYVEEFLFKPVARRKGFVEKDKWGNEVVLYPRLSFTRLALRDSQDTYDALFNLYQKGSISVDMILELFNIDPQDTKLKIERDLFTVNDSTFNEVIRGAYSEVGRMIADKTNIMEHIAKYLNLKVKEEPAEGGGGRF